jgi:hypothetical protein
MRTLQDILQARLASDPRLHIGAIEKTKAGDLRIAFGGIGDHCRVVLAVTGNDVAIVTPEVAGVPIQAGDEPDAPIYELPIDPTDHTKDVLIQIAAERGVGAVPSDTKAEIAEAINSNAGFAAE